MPSKRLKTSIQINFILAILIPLVITNAIVLFAYFNTHKAYDSVHNSKIVSLIARQMARDIEQAQDRLSSLALFFEKEAVTQNALIEVLEKIVQSQPNLSEIRILNPDHIIDRVVPANPEITGFDMSGADVVKDAVARSRPVWSKAHLSLATKAPTAFLAIPFSRGMLIGVFDFAVFQDRLEEIGLDQGRMAAVVDEGGIVLSHTNTQMALSRQWLPIAEDVRDRIQQNLAHSPVSVLNDQWMITGSLVSPTGWLVLLYQDKALLFDHVRQLGIVLIAISLLLTALGGVLSIRISSRFFKYFQRLTQNIQEVADGNYTPDTVGETYKELQQVSRDFSRMTQEIEARQQQVQRQHEHYRIVADYTYDWELWLSPEGRIKYSSPSCERITGFPRQAFLDDPGLSLSIVCPGDQEKMAAHFKSAHMTPAGAQNLEFRIRTKDGKIRWIYHHCNPVYSDSGQYLGRRISNKDITESKKSQIRLAENEQRFRELFNNMRAGVAIYDSKDGENFYFKDMNAAGLISVKKSLEQVKDREIKEVFPSVEALGLLAVFKQVFASGRPVHHPTRIYKDDALEIHVENYVCKLPSGEIVAIFDDVSERVLAEREKKSLESRILQAQKMESIGHLAGGIAHDFNNLLFPIMGNAEMLLEDLAPGSREHENVKSIYDAGQRASDLVRQILSFSRQEELQILAIGYQSILKEVFKLCRSTIPANIEITRDIQQNCGKIMANPTQLHQVAMNLITNAYHAVSKDSGTISVRLFETTMAPEPARQMDLTPGSYAILEVGDNGKGIAPDHLDKVFDPYFTTKEKGRGTGLGLSVVFAIVKEFKGHITVSSQLDKGSVFRVYLPIVQTGAPLAQSPVATPIKGGTERIMVVDDEPFVTQLNRQILERYGYTVVAHTSPEKALAQFADDPQGFDLVVTDMTMPKLTGDKLCMEVLKIRPGTPMIICTGFSERINEKIAADLGVKALLMKPVVHRDLLEKVRQVLDE